MKGFYAGSCVAQVSNLSVNAIRLPSEKRLYCTGKMIILLVCCLDYSYCSHNTLKIFLRVH